MDLLGVIIRNSVNVGYGIGLAIIVVAVLLLIVIAIKGGKSISPLSYLIAVILATALSFQFSYMFGAIATKQRINDVSDSLTGLSQLIPWSDECNSALEGIGEAVNEFKNLVPGLSAEVDQLDFGKFDLGKTKDSLVVQAKSYINKYIWHRVLWSLLFIVIAVIPMILLSGYGDTGGYRRSRERGERVVSRRQTEGRSPRRTRRY